MIYCGEMLGRASVSQRFRLEQRVKRGIGHELSFRHAESEVTIRPP